MSYPVYTSQGFKIGTGSLLQEWWIVGRVNKHLCTLVNDWSVTQVKIVDFSYCHGSAFAQPGIGQSLIFLLHSVTVEYTVPLSHIACH